MERIPEPLQRLVNQLGRLPGLGPKSAMRIAMRLLKWPEDEAKRLGEMIIQLRNDLCLCSQCGALCEASPCPVCSDTSRNREQLCVVPDWDSMLVIEEGGFYRGFYAILGGLLSPLDHIGSDSLEIDRIEARLSEGRINEVIFALGATLEAETTASYLKTRIASKFPSVRISRLAQGIPLGQEVRFTDKETLRQALKYRQDL